MQQTTTAVQTKLQPAPSVQTHLSLRARKTVEQKPARTRRTQPKNRRQQKIRWVLSWTGLEELRDQVRSLAREARDSDAVVRATHGPSSVATGLICGAIRDPSTAPSAQVARAAEAQRALRDPSTAPSAQVARAAEAQRALRDLHAKLVWEHHLEFDLVRREWATILDPSPAEAELCERLVAQAVARSARA